MNLPESAFEGPAAWRSSTLSESWVVPASPELIAELEAGARRALADGKSPEELTRADFPGPVLASASDGWLAELDSGRGFLLLRGLPVVQWGEEVSELAYLGIGLTLGTLASQNAAGDLLGHVRDTGADPNDPSVRLYRTREEQPFHTDGADVIGLLCLRGAKSGGASRVVSSTAVFGEIARQRPDLAPRLFEPFHFDRNEEQQEGAAPTFELPIAHWDGTRLRGFYIGWYIRDAQRHSSVPRLSSADLELLDLIDATALDPSLYLEMEFRPGDVQLLKNSSILHARTEYEDAPAPEPRRHLLRFWVSARGDFGGSDARLNAGIDAKEGVASDREDFERA